jgi:hypothetical protein
MIVPSLEIPTVGAGHGVWAELALADVATTVVDAARIAAAVAIAFLIRVFTTFPSAGC